MENEGVKVLDAAKGILGGWGIPFGGPVNGKDLDGEFFEQDTDFALDWFPNDGRPLLYAHGTDLAVKSTVVGRQISHRLDPEVGVWAEVQLNMAHRYAEAIMELAGQGVLGFSSGSMKHLVVGDEATGKILRWPWVELSLTPVPANPYALIGPDAVKHLAAVGLELPEGKAELKPYPNEHACRLRDPGDFQPDTFRRTSRKHEGKTYDIILGRLKNESSMIEQAYRYPKDEWTEAEARAHCKAHDGISFEPASGGKQFIGLTFADQAERVVVQAQALVDRSKSFVDSGAKEGRVLAAANRKRLADLLPHLRAVADDLETLLKETEPAAEKGLALFAEYQRILARLYGVPIP